MKNLSASCLRLFWLLPLLWLVNTSTAHAQAWQWANSPGIGTGYGTATDAAGNVYVTGTFSGTATFGATVLTSAGSDDIFVAKLNSTGAYQWAVRAGGNSIDEGRKLALDGSGNIYVTGTYYSSAATFGAVTLTNSDPNYNEVFVAKLSSAGIWQWAARGGGISYDDAQGVAVDGSGNVYVTGYISGATATFGATTFTTGGWLDVYVAKLNSSGVWQWAVRAGGTSREMGTGVGVDLSGNVYVTGEFGGQTAFGATTLTVSGNSDVFVAKLSSGGVWLWATKAGGAEFSTSTGLAVDANSNVYITGSYSDSYMYFSSIYLANTSDLNSGTAFYSDGFVAKLTSAGVWQWAANIGGESNEQGRALAVDAGGNVSVTGYFQSDTATFGSNNLQYAAGGTNLFVGKLTTYGTWQWAVGAGGTSVWGYGLAIDGNANAYATGHMNGIGNAFFGSVTVPSTSNYTVFVARLSQSPTVSSFAPAAGAPGATVTLTGINLNTVTSVSIGGVAAISFAAVSPTNMNVVVPAGAVTGPIVVSNAYGTATSTGSFTVYGPPSILSFTPISGPPGTSVVINGANLTGALSVKFNSVTATSTINSATQITAIVPATATTGPLSIVTPGGLVTSAALYTVTSPVVTTVSSFSPTSGPSGTTVTITGVNFTGATDVKFGLVSATGFTVNSDAQIVTTVPTGAVTGKVSVTSPTGTGQSAGSFTVSTTPFITSISPGAGGTGMSVVFTGSNFTGATAVKFNLTDATFTVNSDTQLTAIVPVGATSGTVKVVKGAATGTGPSFSIVAVPTISSFSPTSGPVGTVVTLTGTNLRFATALTINGVACTNMSSTITEATGTVPVGANLGAGPATVSLTTSGGTATAAGKFTVTGAVGLAVDSVRAIPGQVVTVPVRATTALSSLIALQGALDFDVAGGLSFASVSSFGLSGLTAGSFGTTGAATGRLTFAWNSGSNAPVNVAANGILFTLSFNVAPTVPLGTALYVRFTNAGTPVEIINSAFTTLTFTTKHGKAQVPGAAVLSGTVRTGNGTPVPGVTLAVSGPLVPPASLTPADGTFSQAGLVSTGAYTLTPVKANDVTVTNGVTVADVALIQRHILGTTLLGATYKVVSADVNNDATITVADVATLQGFIVGNTSSFTGGALWRFFSSAQTFANPNVPGTLIQSRTYASLTTSTAQDFVGCKLGDVNDSWNAAIPRPAGAPGDTLRVGFPSMTVAPAGRFRLPLVVEAGPACGGLQGEISWDPTALRLIGTTSTRPGLVLGVPDTAAGHLPMLWTDPAGQPLHGPATLVEVEFEAHPGAAPGSVTLVDGPRTALLALDSALAPLALLVQPGILSVGPVPAGLGSSRTAAAALWPNPAHALVRLTGAPRAAVAVLDGLGRAGRRTNLDAAGAGTLDVRGLPTGLYTVRIGGAARRLVVE